MRAHLLDACKVGDARKVAMLLKDERVDPSVDDNACIIKSSKKECISSS